MNAPPRAVAPHSAGGVGGLLSIRDEPTAKDYWATCDANGNVTQLVDAGDHGV